MLLLKHLRVESDLAQRTRPSPVKLCAALGSQSRISTSKGHTPAGDDGEPFCPAGVPTRSPDPHGPPLPLPEVRLLEVCLRPGRAVRYLPLEKGCSLRRLLPSLCDLPATVCTPVNKPGRADRRAWAERPGARKTLPAAAPAFLTSPLVLWVSDIPADCHSLFSSSARLGMAWLETQCSGSFCTWPLPGPRPQSLVSGLSHRGTAALGSDGLLRLQLPGRSVGAGEEEPCR